MKHPIQPLYKSDSGILRFKLNKIVRFILDNGGFDMNKLAMMDFSREDREQFAQLIGYSLSGFGELDYVSNETYEAAHLMAENKSESAARIESLEKMLADVKAGLKLIVPVVFPIHPDDLEESE